MWVYCTVLVVCLLKSKISHLQHIQRYESNFNMVKALLVLTCSYNVFCSQSHEEYTSHVEADLCRLKLNVTAGKPSHGSHPTQTNCWQLEKGNTCNNDNPKAVTAPKKGNTTHATMTTQKQLHHPKRVL